MDFFDGGGPQWSALGSSVGERGPSSGHEDLSQLPASLGQARAPEAQLDPVKQGSKNNVTHFSCESHSNYIQT